MNRPKCYVHECMNNALLLLGDKWICGECFMKIHNKRKEEANKLIEELEI